jgi:regulator of sigma E protease
MIYKLIKTGGYVVAALLGLTLVVVVHEYGHFSACKLFGVRTPVFSVGFPPKLASKRIGQTNFQVGALFLGGYVSINRYDFDKLGYANKMIIILAGIIFNLLFAALVYYALVQYKKNKFINSQDMDQKELGVSNNLYLGSAAPDSVKELLKDQKRGFVGPLGIITLIAQGAALGYDAFFYFLALMSLNLAFFNILPIPFLDGGEALDITLKALFGNSPQAVWLIYALYIVLACAWFLRSRRRLPKR